MMVIIGLIIMLLLGTVYTWGVFTFEVETFYDIGSTLSGLPYMVSLVFYALFMFLSGKFIDKYPPRIILIVGSLLVATGWILSSFATHLWLLVITYGIILGSGVGIAYGIPLKVVNMWFVKNRGLASGMVLVGFGLSPVLTAPIAKTLVLNYGIFETFRILGIGFGLILFTLSFFVSTPDHQQTNQNENNSNEIPVKEMIKTSLFKGLYINLTIGTTIGLMMIGISSIIGVEYIKMDYLDVSLLLSVFAISNGLGRPIFGMITDKYTARKALFLSYALIFIASILMLFAGPGTVYLYIISFMIFWFNLGGILAIISTTTVRRFGKKNFASNYGLIFTAYGIGAVIGMLSSGFFLDVLHQMSYIFMMILILSISGFFITHRYVGARHESKENNYFKS